MAISSTHLPKIPPDARTHLSDPWVPWMINPRLFGSLQPIEGASYRKAQVLPSDGEWSFVWRCFHDNKPTKWGIRNVYCIHSSDQTRFFESSLPSMKQEVRQFPPTWGSEPRAEQRALVIDRWKEAKGLFSPFQSVEKDGRRHTWKEVGLLPLWHGSSERSCASICESGFTFFGKVALDGNPTGSTDEGYFGSGIYFTDSARYAADIYSRGNLILSWVSMREPFPVVGDPNQQDMSVLKGRGAYKNYNAHYIPVAPMDDDPDCVEYLPCQMGQVPTCDEVVVFQKAQVLVRYVIELQVEHPAMGKLNRGCSCAEDLIFSVFKCLQLDQVYSDKKLRNVLYRTLEELLLVSKDEDLSDQQQIFSVLLEQLIDGNGQVDKGVREQLTKSLQTPTRSVLPPNPYPPIAFGPSEWARYFGDVGPSPRLPQEISSILDGPCPFWEGKKTSETHALVYIPQTVGGLPFTIRLLGNLIERPKMGYPAKYARFWPQAMREHGDIPIDSPHWILVTKDVIPRSRGKVYLEQIQIVARHPGYNVPEVLQIAASILLEHVRTGHHLFPFQPLTGTRCRETTEGKRLDVGGFRPEGLILCTTSNDDPIDCVGIAGVRRFG